MKKHNKQKRGNTVYLRDFLRRNLEDYQAISKKEKSRFLLHAVIKYKVHRKSVIRLIRTIRQVEVGVPTKHSSVIGQVLVSEKAGEKRGRPPKYKDDDELIWWLETLCLNMGFPNDKYMVPMLPDWIEKSEDPGLTSELRGKLLELSESTVGRLLGKFRKRQGKKYSPTKRSNNKKLITEIPLRPLDFEAPCCGFLEMDTVSHCGNSIVGLFGRSLNAVDHKTLWTEQEAFLGNTGENVKTGLIEIRKRLPFAIKGGHSDCGCEFINEIVVGYLGDPKDFVVQTHGRAYKKNDQARVEQSNWSHVRQIFGYDRVDSQKLIDKMNDIYRNEHRLLNNFFRARRKTIQKERVGSKLRYKYDKPMTPYRRVLGDPTVSELTKERLREEYKQLNPYELKKRLDQKMKFFEKALKQLSRGTDTQEKEAA